MLSPISCLRSLDGTQGIADTVAVYDVRGQADVDRLADLVLERTLTRPGRPA